MFVTAPGARGISPSNSPTEKSSGYMFKDMTHTYSLHSKKMGWSSEKLEHIVPPP